MSRAAKAGAPSWVSGWRHRAAGPTNPSNISNPAPLPAFDVQSPLRMARGAAVAVLVPFAGFHRRRAGVWTGTAAVYALGILVTAVALGRSAVLSGASGDEQVRLLALGGRSPPCRSGLALSAAAAQTALLVLLPGAVWSG